MPTPTRLTLVLTNDGDTLKQRMASAPALYGFETSVTDDPEAALARTGTDPPGMMLVDLDHAGADPLTFLERLHGFDPGAVVLLVSGDSMPALRAAVERGFSWYVHKSANEDEWKVVFARARRETQRHPLPVEFLGFNPEVQAAVMLAEQAASLEGHVTLVGERGVGRRALARLIHERSHRRGGAFTHFSCAGLSAQMVEHTLFGSASPPAGVGDGAGLLEKVHGGTLVIEDVTELGKRAQEALLRVLKVRKLRKAGPGPAAGRAVPVDVRLVALSGGTLNDAVASGGFLRELADELTSFHATIPPLRHRKHDIPVLADHFARRAARTARKPVRGVSDEAVDRMMRYDWPGNVTELKHMVVQAVGSTSGVWLAAEDLPALPDVVRFPSSWTPGSTIQQLEREAILRTLDSVGGSTGRAAKLLNVSVRKIQYKLKEYRKEATTTLPSEKVETVARPPRSRIARPAKAVFFTTQDPED